MKRHILKAFLLSATMVYLSVPSVAPSAGQIEYATNIEETDLKAESTPLFSGISGTCYGLLAEPIIEDMSVIKQRERDAELAGIDSLQTAKEKIVAYKEVMNKYSDYLESPESLYDRFTAEELSMFFSVVQAEIGDEYSFEQKCNVASVILNRVNSLHFDDEMSEILTADQFETISTGRYKDAVVSEDTILACEYVFSFGDTTGGALFFDSNNALNYKFLFNDGAHNFYTVG